MILIADSGSTKTDWKVIKDKGGLIEAKTQGLNPFFKSTEDCKVTFLQELLPQLEDVGVFEIKQIWFYGAGCSSAEKCKILEDAFEAVFPKAEINVDHDLLGAARALCGDQPGMAAILGTGSNSCFFDGTEIVRNVTALGYILGDEGSGSQIGKKLIKDYLDHEVPDTMRDLFDKKFGYSKEQLLDEVYIGDLPNRFLASFSKWIYQIKEDEFYAKNLIIQCLESFFDKHICKYSQHQDVPLHIVGSVGFYNRVILADICKMRGITLGQVIEAPIEGLTAFHSA
jgi:glucosamine kinase